VFTVRSPSCPVSAKSRFLYVLYFVHDDYGVDVKKSNETNATIGKPSSLQ